MRYSHNYAETGRWLKGPVAQRDHGGRGGRPGDGRHAGAAPDGAHAGSLEVEEGPVTDRVSALVVSEDPASAPLEFGNAKTGGVGRNLLERAAEAAGYDVSGGE